MFVCSRVSVHGTSGVARISCGRYDGCSSVINSSPSSCFSDFPTIHPLLRHDRHREKGTRCTSVWCTVREPSLASPGEDWGASGRLFRKRLGGSSRDSPTSQPYVRRWQARERLPHTVLRDVVTCRRSSGPIPALGVRLDRNHGDTPLTGGSISATVSVPALRKTFDRQHLRVDNGQLGRRDIPPSRSAYGQPWCR